jgi:hypothetical protein
MLLGRALECCLRAGRPAGLVMPRAAHREPRLPRRPCRLVPHRLEVRAAGSPPRRPSRDACHIFVPHCTAAALCPGGPSPAPLRTQADVGCRTAALKPCVPSLHPAYKGRASAITAQATAPAGPASARRRGATPSAANTAAGRHFSQPP